MLSGGGLEREKRMDHVKGNRGCAGSPDDDFIFIRAILPLPSCRTPSGFTLLMGRLFRQIILVAGRELVVPRVTSV